LARRTEIDETLFRLTPQRMAIMEFLKGSASHPSAREIFNGLHESYSNISFATVYNTLQALKKRGMVRELTIDQREKRYDPAPIEHHHFLCTSCGNISDVHPELRLALPTKELGGGRVSSYRVQFYGLCRQCHKKEKEVPSVMAVFKCEQCGETKEGRCKPKKCKKCEGQGTYVKQE